MIQWLRPHASNAGGPGSTSGRRPRTLHAMRCYHKKIFLIKLKNRDTFFKKKKKEEETKSERKGNEDSKYIEIFHGILL